MRVFPGLSHPAHILRAPEDDGGETIEPVVETEAVVVDELVEEVAADDPSAEVQATEQAAEEDAEEQPKKRVPWYMDRLGKTTAQAKEAQERAAHLERENKETRDRLAAYEALYGKQDGGTATTESPAGAKTYTQQDVEAEAARLSNMRSLNQRLEGLFEDGVKRFPNEFKQRVDKAAQAFGTDLQQRPDFFEAVAELPNSTDVYHELAGDLDHLAEVLAMTPMKLGMELVRLSNKLASKPKGPAVSRAPSPISPIDGNAKAAETDLGRAPMEDYVKIRERQREARRAQH